jgi:hypothetical protein
MTSPSSSSDQLALKRGDQDFGPSEKTFPKVQYFKGKNEISCSDGDRACSLITMGYKRAVLNGKPQKTQLKFRKAEGAIFTLEERENCVALAEKVLAYHQTLMGHLSGKMDPYQAEQELASQKLCLKRQIPQLIIENLYIDQ